jgi:hypothetical protein
VLQKRHDIKWCNYFEKKSGIKIINVLKKKD